MADGDNLIEIPDDDELLSIANQVNSGQFGTEGDDGDLSLTDLTGGDSDPDERPYQPRKTPARGAVSYLSIGIPLDVYVAFAAHDERDAKHDPQYHEATPEAERFVQWLQSVVGRDMEADERRPADQRQYWWGGLYRGLSYQKLVEETHRKDDGTKLRQQLKHLREQQIARVRAKLGGDWTDDAIDDLLGPDGTLDD